VFYRPTNSPALPLLVELRAEARNSNVWNVIDDRAINFDRSPHRRVPVAVDESANQGCESRRSAGRSLERASNAARDLERT